VKKEIKIEEIVGKLTPEEREQLGKWVTKALTAMMDQVGEAISQMPEVLRKAFEAAEKGSVGTCELRYVIEYATSAIVQIEEHGDIETALKYIQQAEDELSHAKKVLELQRLGEKQEREHYGFTSHTEDTRPDASSHRE
jgi:hypothetical protein